MAERNQSTPRRAATIESPSRPRRGDGEDADDELDEEEDDRDDADDLDEESRRSFGVGALSTSAWDRTRGASTAPPRDTPEGEEQAPDTQRQGEPSPDSDWDTPTIPDLEPFQSPEEQK